MGARNKTPLDIARNRKSAIESEWRKHVKACGTCITLHATASRYCMAGWVIVRTYRQVSNEILALAEPVSESGDNLLW